MWYAVNKDNSVVISPTQPTRCHEQWLAPNSIVLSKGCGIFSDEVKLKTWSDRPVLLQKVVAPPTIEGVHIGKYVFDHKERTLTTPDNPPVILNAPVADMLKILLANKNNITSYYEFAPDIKTSYNPFVIRRLSSHAMSLRVYLNDDENIEIREIYGEGFMLSEKNS